jgi:hypothetical protein
MTREELTQVAQIEKEMKETEGLLAQYANAEEIEVGIWNPRPAQMTPGLAHNTVRMTATEIGPAIRTALSGRLTTMRCQLESLGVVLS